MSIRELSPSALWGRFADICEIPRPSKHEAKLITFICDLAKTKGLNAVQDNVGNLLVRKPASIGCENSPTLVLQSHLDMVMQKRDDILHDFYQQGIDAKVDKGWVRANGTTLGADNGIGVAAILALLESDHVTHGPLEALFTVDEEAGMSGAAGLSKDWLHGKILLNLDTEEEGELYLGCAGGVDLEVAAPVTRECVPEDYCFFEVTWSGLKGGHSGIDIHRGRGNAIKIAVRTLLNARHEFQVRLHQFTGGTLRNALPRSASAIVAVPEVFSEEFCQYLEAQRLLTCFELKPANDQLNVSAVSVPHSGSVLTESCQLMLLQAMYDCPHGVMQMSKSFDGVVETSNNLATVNLNEEMLTWQCLLRSLDDQRRDEAIERLVKSLETSGADVKVSGAYPGWTPSKNSKVLSVAQKVHRDIYGYTAREQVIHAGLECGLLGRIYPEWDMISFGPTIQGAHSPDERVNIESVSRFWTYLCALLEELSTH